jgi:hypothetical protein
MYQVTEEDITELQTELGILETEHGITPLTVFSPINNSGKFQITGQHIKEMRDSVEKLLTALGLTKIDYFNYDEDGNHIIHPLGDKTDWTDPITDATELIKFQVKYIHIEDLRHFIQTIVTWIERFFITPIADIVNLSSTYTGTTSEVLVDDKSFYGDKGEWYEDISATLSASATTANGYSTGNLHVFVTTNDSISHLLKIVFSGEAFCSSSHQSGAITIFDQRRINITNGSIEFFGNINQKLKITSKVTATSSATLSDLIKTGVSFEITFGSGRSLGYAYGKTDLSFAIILSNFTNLNLNIGTDYLTKFGAIPEGETVMAINILVSFSLAAQMGNTEIESIDAQITNIAVTNTD